MRREHVVAQVGLLLLLAFGAAAAQGPPAAPAAPAPGPLLNPMHPLERVLTGGFAGPESYSVLAGEGYKATGRAVATLVDLACETKGYDLFRSEDPMEAARFVVSDAVGALWVRTPPRRAG